VICNIQQTEVYNSATYNDRLTIVNAESSRTLEEDLNFIRSVILSIYGLDLNDPQNKWYKVPFFTLKYLYDNIENLRSYIISEVSRLDGRIDDVNEALNYHVNDEFSVEHYTTSENPALKGQHKSITARGTLTVFGASLLKSGLTVEMLDPSLNAIWSKGNVQVDGLMRVNGNTLVFGNFYVDGSFTLAGVIL